MILAQIDEALAADPQEKILAFCCNWCSYAGADFAGVSRLQYPPAVRIIRTMCAGRVHPKFIRHAFARGAGQVLVTGCFLFRLFAFSPSPFIRAATGACRFNYERRPPASAFTSATAATTSPGFISPEALAERGPGVAGGGGVPGSSLLLLRGGPDGISPRISSSSV